MNGRLKTTALGAFLVSLTNVALARTVLLAVATTRTGVRLTPAAAAQLAP